MVMASEVGVLDIPPEHVLQKGRLQPGRMFLVDTEEGRIVADEEIKLRIATEKPYGQWLRDNLVTLQELPEAPSPAEPDHETVLQRQQAFGYSREDVEQLVLPMGKDGVEPVGSMGNDTPLAVLSERPQLLYNYFKQLFAQVTNPPIDAIREEIIMAADTTIGPERNLLEPTPLSAHQIKLASPDPAPTRSWRSCATCDGTNGRRHGLQGHHPPDPLHGRRTAAPASSRRWPSCAAAPARPSRDGHNILILSDRGIDARERAHPRPAGRRRRAPPPDPRGHAHPGRPRPRERRAARGAPLRPAHRLRRGRHQPVPRLRDPARPGPRRACCPASTTSTRSSTTSRPLNKGVVKVISKMGISTIQSYCGAQIFEAIGPRPGRRSTSTSPGRRRASRGIGIDVIAREATAAPLVAPSGATGRRPARSRSRAASTSGATTASTTSSTRRSIHKLQHACRTNDFKLFKRVQRSSSTTRRSGGPRCAGSWS